MEKEKKDFCTKNQLDPPNSPENIENAHKEKPIINKCAKNLQIPSKYEVSSSYIIPHSNDISKVNNAFLNTKKDNLTNFKINEKEEFFIELENLTNRNDEFDEDNELSNKSVYVASKGFAGKGYYKAINEVYRRIRDENRDSEDFDDESFITDIMKSLNVEQKLRKANISLREHRREEKKKFIKQYGKIIVELLTPQTVVVDANEIGNKYGVSPTTVYKIIQYLENKYKIKVQLPNTQPTIEKNPNLSNHPTYILIETIKRKIEEDLGKIISHQFLARDILKRPVDFIAKKYSLIRSGEQGTLSDDVFFCIKSRIIKYYTQKNFKIPDRINRAFKNYKAYLVQHRYTPPVSVTPELSQNITYKFLITIKSEIENYLDRRITNREFSKTFLGRHAQFLEDKFGKIRRERYLGYLMKDLFANIKDIIFTFFTHEKAPISDILNEAFDNYEDYLILARYIRSNKMSQKFHPHLISDYFRKIDSKEKAYWLGFMFADGYVILRSARNNSKTIGMALSIKDENTLDLLINTLGLNISYKNYFESERFDKNGVLKMYRYCRINWNHQSMADDLINHGVVPNKSKVIRLPELNNSELYLAFLLGYFDGDGHQRTTRIFSGSKKFLEDIKFKFKIRNEIGEDHRTEYIHPITQEIIKKDTYVYRLSLGSNLFNHMLNNYTESIERKRFFFVKPRKFKEDYITREDLQKLVRIMPLSHIAEMLNISTDYIKKWCDEWEITKPDHLYWSRRTAGRRKKKEKN